MRITPVYNLDLLNEIREAERISYDDLRERHSEKVKTIFDNELDTLVSMGYIELIDDVYVYVRS